jgi:DNA topoisomerase-1
MNLVIVESRSKIKTIEKILGKNYKVMASSGHIDNLPKKELGIDLENNFKPKYQILSDKRKNLEDLRDQCRKASLVWLATDKDFEGERIAEALRIHCRLSKLNRVYFTEITPKAIQESFQNPVSHLHQGYLDCQETRRILDRLIGYQLSPILWKHFPMNRKKPISIGRVQSATLMIVRNREEEIKNFQHGKKWHVTGFFKSLENNEIQAVLFPVQDQVSFFFEKLL